MSEFLRPAAVALLRRWREVAFGAAVAAVGLWWGLAAFGPTAWAGWVVAAGGAALTWAALARLRFGRGGGGQGVVEIDERRLAYFGPLTGGMIDLDDLVALDLDPAARPPRWILTGPGGARLAIPADAEGADALFDLFAALPGLSPARLIAAQSQGGTAPVPLWRRGTVRRLH